MGLENLNLFEVVSRILLLASVLLSSANQPTTTEASLIHKTFQKSISTTLGINRLTSPWYSPSLTACLTRCLADYVCSCESVIYHADLHLCTPGSHASMSLPAPDATEGDLYSRVFPTCGPNNAFTQVACNDIQACVKLQDAQAFIQHRTECTLLGGFLASARTMDKLSLLQSFAGSTAFIGLDDLITEGTFVWHDTNLNLTASETSELFNSGEPNNHNSREDCVVHRFWGQNMNDVPCTNNYPAICEFPLL